MQGSNLRPRPCESVEYTKQDAGHSKKNNELCGTVRSETVCCGRLSGAELERPGRNGLKLPGKCSGRTLADNSAPLPLQ